MAVARPTSVPWLEIVVPARNEQDRLPAGLALLCQKAAELPSGVQILIVNSASTDSTAEIARNWPTGPVPVRLVECTEPGKGAAVRAGLLATCGQYVGFCDADMATDLAAMDIALSLLICGHDVVVGSRAHPESRVQVRHSLLRRLGAVAFRGVAGHIARGVRDTQCGFKFFAGPMARSAAAMMTANGFAFDIELIACCQLLGARPVEIPVNWHDVPGSTFSVARHSLAAFHEATTIWSSMRRRRRQLKRIPVRREPSPSRAAVSGSPASVGGIPPASDIAAQP